MVETQNYLLLVLTPNIIHVTVDCAVHPDFGIYVFPDVSQGEDSLLWRSGCLLPEKAALVRGQPVQKAGHIEHGLVSCFILAGKGNGSLLFVLGVEGEICVAG